MRGDWGERVHPEGIQADQLLTGIREVGHGGSYLSPRLLTRLVDGYRALGRSPVRQPRFGSLTKREREVLKLLAEGQSVKDIAAGFDLSVKTIEAHKFNLMRKLDIHNKAQLVQYAIQKKVIRLKNRRPANRALAGKARRPDRAAVRSASLP